MSCLKVIALLIVVSDLVITKVNKTKVRDTELLYNAIQNYDELCFICIKNLRTKKYHQLNETEWKNNLLSRNRILFPYCHGYHLCDDCIYYICSHSTTLKRECPYCRRDTIPMFKQNNKSQNERYQFEADDINLADYSIAILAFLFTLGIPQLFILILVCITKK